MYTHKERKDLRCEMEIKLYQQRNLSNTEVKIII